jgi:cyclohexyl-isocyanide hydratase
LNFQPGGVSVIMASALSRNLLHIGAILFPQIDQADFTGPFEVLSRIPDTTFYVIGRNLAPVRDVRGLVLTPQTTFADAPPLDVLLVPGGAGVNAVMEDPEMLSFIREQAAGAKIIFSVCTGAFLLGAAGLLKGRRATTHWASHHLLALLGAVPVDERVVVDGNLVTAAGVTAGIDGALRVAAMLRGANAARAIQLYLEYAPEPPFPGGTPETAAADILHAATNGLRDVIDARLAVVQRIAANSRLT